MQPRGSTLAKIGGELAATGSDEIVDPDQRQPQQGIKLNYRARTTGRSPKETSRTRGGQVVGEGPATRPRGVMLPVDGGD
eukprot:164702-Pyramimonas_sp.AAC.1